MEKVLNVTMTTTESTDNTSYNELSYNATLKVEYLDPLSPTNIITNMVMVILMVFICLGNGVIIYIVCRLSSMRTPTNAFITCLATADFIVGLNIPYQLAVILIPDAEDRFSVCITTYVLGYFTVGTSMMSCLG